MLFPHVRQKSLEGMLIVLSLFLAFHAVVVSASVNVTQAKHHSRYGCAEHACTEWPFLCRCPLHTQDKVLSMPENVPCGQARNPLEPYLAFKSRVLVFHNAAQRRPVGLGNELLGFISVFYEAMRAGRAMVLEDSGMIAKLKHASRLGVPFATSTQLAAKHELKNRSAHLAHDSSHLFSSDFPVVVSKGNNVKLVRPRKWPYECYREALKCPPRPSVADALTVDPTAESLPQSSLENSSFSATTAAATTVAAIKSVDEHETHPAYTCVERRALRQLIVGVSPQLKALASKLEQHWSGDQARLKRLLEATANSSEPIWQLALHARTQFGFVEAGIDEREPIAIEEAKNWTLDAGVQSVLAGIVDGVKEHLKKNEVNRSNTEGLAKRGLGEAAVYIASESLIARQHIAALLRAQGIEADYHTLQGTSHPATIDKVEHRHSHSERTLKADKYANSTTAHVSGSTQLKGTITPKNAADAEKKRETLETHRELTTEDEKCNAYIFFLEWWALAQSRRVIARRGSELGVRRYPLWRFYDRWGVRPSSFAESALIYGGWD